MTSGTPAPAVHEIVHVEIDGMRLYAEVIQVIHSRTGQRFVSAGYPQTDGPRLWVRPLCIRESCISTSESQSHGLPQVYDLRGGADLVWPADVFQEVLDTEWMEIIPHLKPEAPPLGMLAVQEPSHAKLASHKLKQFLEAVQPH